MQSVLRHIYPPRCRTCDAQVTSDFGLCDTCWRETRFLTNLVCDNCGAPLPGEDEGTLLFCNDCLTIARPLGPRPHGIHLRGQRPQAGNRR